MTVTITKALHNIVNNGYRIFAKIINGRGERQQKMPFYSKNSKTFRAEVHLWITSLLLIG